MRLRMFNSLAAGALAISMMAPGGAALGVEQAAAQAAVDTSCTLVPEGSKHEFASCLRVTAALDKAPAVGETATLTVNVEAQRDLGEVTVSVNVPTGLDVVSGPGTDGAAVGATAGPGAIVPRLATVEPGVGSEALSFDVKAADNGATLIEVYVTAQVDGFTDGAMTIVPLTVADKSGKSELSVETPTRGAAVEATGSRSIAQPDPNHEAAPAAKVDSGQAAAAAGTNGLQSCTDGRWVYDNPTLGSTGVPNYGIQVWDEDDFGPNDLLGSTVTAFDGSWEVCWTDKDGAAEGPGAQEVYVLYRAENSVWRVRDTSASDETYENQSATVQIDEGDDFGWGDRSPANGIDRAIHAFHAIDKLWQWGNDPSGDCFDWGATVCRQLTINWTSTSTDGTFYSLSGNDVHLLAADPDSEHVVIHEATHAVMDDVYNDSFPSFPNCSPHFIQGVSSTGCAWTEGFAEWVPAAVLNDPFFRFIGGNNDVNLENVDVNSADWSDGDAVEGRVAGAMIDIQDSAVATLDFFDFWSETDMDQYEVFQDFATIGNGVRPATYAEFWSDRGTAGLNRANTGANGSNNQNTIDYSFTAPECAGFTVTEYGTKGNNTINGTSGVDVIHGLAGTDTIDGLAGADVLCGGDGVDTIEGGSEADEIQGGPGNDTIKGQEGEDDIEGDDGADTIEGGTEADEIHGEIGNDTIEGNGSADDIWGDDGADDIEGNEGADVIFGGDDADEIRGGLHGDTIEGDGGNDDLYGEDGPDELRGEGGSDDVIAGSGADDLGGGSGSPDYCDGGDGSDTHLGGCEDRDSIP